MTSVAEPKKLQHSRPAGGQASALTAGIELVGSSGLNSMPEASHPAASRAIVPAIQYERRMIRRSFVNPNAHQICADNEQLSALDRRSVVVQRSNMGEGP